MRTENTPETFIPELRTVSPAEIARIAKEVRRMRAEAQVDLLRSAARGTARLGRALVTLQAAARPTRRGMKQA